MGRPKNPFPPQPKDGPNGKKRVWWQGQWHHLGTVDDDPAWRAEYSRLITLWAADPTAVPLRPDEYLVSKLCTDYLASSDSPPPGHRRYRVGLAIEMLLNDHAGTPVNEFGPLALKAWQAKLCTMQSERETGKTRYGRSTISEMMGIVRQIWKWGVATERVDVTRRQALLTVECPKPGSVREPRSVTPPDPEHVKKVLPFLRPPVRALVQLEWLTGARPSELCGIHVGEIVKSGRATVPGAGVLDLDVEKVWAYVPFEHKLSRKGKLRIVVFGPAEQQILTPLIEGRGPTEYVFRPADSLADLRAERLANRVTPGVNKRQRKASPKKAPGERYDAHSYHRALKRACVLAGVPHFFPYTLRHLAAAEIKAAFGIDAVQAVLGHHTRTMSEHYGGRSFAKAAEVARGRTPQQQS